MEVCNYTLIHVQCYSITKVNYLVCFSYGVNKVEQSQKMMNLGSGDRHHTTANKCLQSYPDVMVNYSRIMSQLH